MQAVFDAEYKLVCKKTEFIESLITFYLPLVIKATDSQTKLSASVKQRCLVLAIDIISPQIVCVREVFQRLCDFNSQ